MVKQIVFIGLPSYLPVIVCSHMPLCALAGNAPFVHMCVSTCERYKVISFVWPLIRKTYDIMHLKHATVLRAIENKMNLEFEF